MSYTFFPLGYVAQKDIIASATSISSLSLQTLKVILFGYQIATFCNFVYESAGSFCFFKVIFKFY